MIGTVPYRIRRAASFVQFMFTRVVEPDFSSLDTPVSGLYLMSPLMYYMPHNIFKYFSNLTELKIMSEVPTLLAIPSKEFVYLKQLKSVQIFGQKVRTLLPETFKGATNIELLLLPSNHIESIHSDAFDGLENVQFLDLSGNLLKTLPKGVFDDLKQLWVFNLANNRLIFVIDDTFKKTDIKLLAISRSILLNILQRSSS